MNKININHSLLEETCLSSIDSFERYGEVFNTPDGIYIHKNNDSNVLAVAHLDTVLSMSHYYVLEINGEDAIFNAQLDDRLGAYTLLHALPSLGIKFDILLTEGEESGRSTAQYFESSKEYNWIFSFDRRGEDVVLYDYESKEITSPLKKHGFKIGIGSFSDICFLDHLHCKGFNVGTGYYGEHSEFSYARPSVWSRQVLRFESFYREYSETRFRHAKDYNRRWNHKTVFLPMDADDWKSSEDDWNSRDDIYRRYPKVDVCRLCYYAPATNEFGICEECMGDADLCNVCNEVVFNFEITDGICSACRDRLYK